eukprot:SAG11_NODE_13058_length_672_cov_0.652705_1_plen_54_part_00
MAGGLSGAVLLQLEIYAHQFPPLKTGEDDVDSEPEEESLIQVDAREQVDGLEI